MARLLVQPATPHRVTGLTGAVVAIEEENVLPDGTSRAEGVIGVLPGSGLLEP